MSQSTDIRQGTIIRIVDDDEDIRDALSFMLECKGWQVRTYGSARDFLTQDSPSIPGCLLLDIRMPDMSGVQLQSLMKEQRIHLPIIFITGQKFRLELGVQLLMLYRRDAVNGVLQADTEKVA